MSDFDDDGHRIPDDDERRDEIDARRARNAHKCLCDDANMPGHCPGPANCPMQSVDDPEDEPDHAQGCRCEACRAWGA